MYYKRARYTLTTIAGENVDQVTSKGISTGTSKDNEKFEQPKKRMETRYKYGESITITATPKEEEDGYTYNFSKWETETQKSTQVFTYDAEKSLKANTYTKIGNTFKGWSTRKGGRVEYEDKQQVKNIAQTNEKITLYAVWEKNTYIICGKNPTSPTGNVNLGSRLSRYIRTLK